MEYRHVPKTGWDVSILSFGCMQFADADNAADAVRRAIKLGVNYFDVAPLYCGQNSETWLGRAIKGLRDKIILTAKSSPGNGGDDIGEYDAENGFGIRTADEARRQIERSMNLLGVDHLDMYHFWTVSSDAVFDEGMKKGGFFEGVLKAKDEGLFEYIGMTTHADSETIIRFIKNSPYEFDMVTLPFHLLDTSRIPAIAFCQERGIGVMAMNPLGGGRLAKRVPLLTRLAEEAGAESPAMAALRYVAYAPGVSAALNGITYERHADEGAMAVSAGPLDPEAAKQLRQQLAEAFEHVKGRSMCSGCGYCMPCPEGIVIPRVLPTFVDLQIPSSSDAARAALADAIAGGAEGLDPTQCTACGECEAKCPNKVDVSDQMAAAGEIWVD